MYIFTLYKYIVYWRDLRCSNEAGTRFSDLSSGRGTDVAMGKVMP